MTRHMSGLNVHAKKVYPVHHSLPIAISISIPFFTNAARDKKDEKHICPLQLPVIERCMVLWSNPGDTFLTPFGGIGSESYIAIKTGRKPIGIELKKSYYDQMIKNCKIAEEHISEIKLFDEEKI